jgi:hypothetical protein
LPAIRREPFDLTPPAIFDATVYCIPHSTLQKPIALLLAHDSLLKGNDAKLKKGFTTRPPV